LRRIIIDEIHRIPFYIHPSYQKQIATTKKQIFWLGMKKYDVEYIARCMECQQIKVDHASTPNRIVATSTAL
jgi:hypothetical protein